MGDRPLREALVSLGAISGNVETLRGAVGTGHTMAVVKADGYGHGAVPSARAALEGGADWLGVADIAEALELRAAGIGAPILAWLHHPGTDFVAAVEAGVDIGVNYPAQLERAASAGSPGRPARVQLKVDTGLGRNGAGIADWSRLFAQAAEARRNRRIELTGLFSHLANAGEQEDLAQVRLLEQAIEAADEAGLSFPLVHLAATAGALGLPSARFDMVRLGIGIYGLSPFEEPAGVRLRPAMELSAEIVAVSTEPARTIATVALGSADGLPRRGSASGEVSIAGARHPLVSAVGLDSLQVDLGADTAWVGDRAVIFGDPAEGVPAADDWAAAAGTINYEIVTRLGPSVARRYRP